MNPLLTELPSTYFVPSETQSETEIPQEEQLPTLLGLVRQDYRKRFPEEIRAAVKYSSVGAMTGLMFDKLVDKLPLGTSTLSRKASTFLFEKHDPLFTIGFVTPNKVDYFMSGFLNATQAQSRDCIAYKVAVKGNPELEERAQNTLIRHQYKEKGAKRTLDYTGIYAGFIATKDLARTTYVLYKEGEYDGIFRSSS